MSDDTLFIPILLGTPRRARASENVARWVHAKMQERVDIESVLFDVRDFDLPRDHYGTEIGDQFPEWRETIIRADGLVIVTPEYNHGYPGALKSVLDLLLKEYIHKAVAFVGVSAGPCPGANSPKYPRHFGREAPSDLICGRVVVRPRCEKRSFPSRGRFYLCGRRGFVVSSISISVRVKACRPTITSPSGSSRTAPVKR